MLSSHLERYLGYADSIRYRSGLARFDVLTCSVAYLWTLAVSMCILPQGALSVQRS